MARAKLLDALFFYEQDARRPLAARVEELQGVIFQERLGTLHDKARRLQPLAGYLAGAIGLPEDEVQSAERAALLAKADLVTAMVTEHSELQGIMGRVYARLSGETEAVALAIGEQYLPRAAGDPLPATPLGRVTALADKLDTVVGCFAVGIIPTGSEDPYALRREATGIVRILAEADYRLSLHTLLARALDGFTIDLAQPAPELLAALTSFLQGRLENLLTVAGITVQVARAVLAVSADVPADALRRAQLIQHHLADPGFAAVVRVATRLANITRGYAGDGFQPELLTEFAETDLYVRYIRLAPRAETLVQHGDFPGLLALLTELAPVIDRFFAETLVMAEVPELRQTRLGLVWRLSQLFRMLADLTQVSV